MTIDQASAFGERLRHLRKNARLTQEELAERAHLSTREVSDLERGVRRRPYRDTVALLSDALDLSREERAKLEESVSRRGPATDRDVVQLQQSPLPVGGFLGAAPDGVLVGRAQEVERIAQVADRAAAGQGRLLLLAGEPGVGKTRLVQEAAQVLRERRFLVVSGSCYESRAVVPYYPFLDVLVGLYQATPDDQRASLLTRRPALSVLLGEAGILIEDCHEEPTQQERLLRTVAGFAAEMAEERAVAILLDDLHWADSASLTLLHHLARATRDRPVLLLGTYRDVAVGREGPLERTLRDLQRDGLLERVEVRRLAPEGTAALIGALLEEVAVSPEFVGLVHRHTDGNPFFTREVLQTLIERGDVFRRDRHWERKAIVEVALPESVRSVIGERVSRLSGEAQELLREASVLGTVFGFDDLQVMSGRAERQVEDLLEEACAAGMVREMGKDLYGFTHALIQGVLYGELLGRRKRRLHLAAGMALERLPEQRRSIRAAELARHFLVGDDADKALTYSLLAAEGAAEMCATVELAEHARTALQLARVLSDRSRETPALIHLAWSLEYAGRYEESERIWQDVMPRLEATGDVEVLVQALCGLGRAVLGGGHVQESKEYLERAVRLHAGGDTGPYALLSVALADFYLGNWDEARHLDSEARDLCRPGASRWYLPALIDGGRVALLQGAWEEAERLLRECVCRGGEGMDREEIAARGLRECVGYARCLLAQSDFATRRLLPEFESLTAILDDPGMVEENRVELLPFLAQLYEAAGDEEQALRRVAAAMEESRDVGHMPALVDALVVYGGMLVRRRRWDESRAALEEALERARSMPYPYQEAKALLELGALQRELGDEQDAGRRIETALVIFRRLGARPDVECAEEMLAQLHA